MSLKLYYDFLSPPSRSLFVLLKASKIPFENCLVSLRKAEQLTNEYANDVSRFRKVPVIKHGSFTVTESIAILRYLSDEMQVSEQLYPKDSKARARVDEYLEWQHNNTRTFVFLYFKAAWIDPLLSGEPPNAKQVANYERKLGDCFDNVERLWLSQSPYIAGDKVSAADVWAASEVEQPRIVGYDPGKGRPVLSKWLNNVRRTFAPYYDEAHSVVNKLAAKTTCKFELTQPQTLQYL